MHSQPTKKRGRKPHPIWKILSDSGDEDMKSKLSLCKHCKEIVNHQGRCDRAIAHLLHNCDKISEDLHEALEVAYPPKQAESDHGSNWTIDDQLEFEDLFAAFIYTNDLPFNIVNYKLIQQVFKKVNPHVKLPSSDKLRSTLLDQAYNRTKSAVINNINSSKNYFTLQNDATEDISEKSIFNFVVSNSRENYFLKSLDASQDSHSGEFIANQIVSAITQDFPISERISSVISDNTNANKASWRILEQRNPTIMAYGCNSHNCHLLVKDISFKHARESHVLTERFHDILVLCKDITKHFKNHRIQGFSLKREQDLHHYPYLSLPGDTRWGSHYHCVRSVRTSFRLIQMEMINENYLHGANEEQRLARETLKSTLFRPHMEQEIQHCEEVLSMFTRLIERFECNNCAVSEVVVKFQDLEDKISDLGYLTMDDKNYIKSKIKHRREFIVRKNHKMALLLDPRYDFTNSYPVSEETAITNLVIGYFVKVGDNSPMKSEQAMRDQYRTYIEFLSRDFTRGNIFFDTKDSLHPLDFWNHYSNLWPGLSELAIRIFSQVCSSADVERSFSHENHIHTKERNRLQTEKVEKLLFIKYNHSKISET